MFLVLKKLVHQFIRVSSQEKAPLIITLFIAGLAWTGVRTIDQLTAAPFIEYEVEPHKLGDNTQRSVRLRNVFYTKEFGCTKVILTSASQKPLKFGEYEVKLEGNYVPVVKPAVNPDQAVFELDKFGPRSSLVLTVRVEGDGPIRLFSSDCGGATGDAADAENGNARSRAVYLEKSFRTFLVANELLVLWGLLTTWLILMIGAAMFVDIEKHSNSIGDPQTRDDLS